MIIDPAFEYSDSKKERETIEWAPVYFLPKVTGDERFVVAIIGRSESGLVFEVANNLDSLKCVYGKGSEFLVKLITETLNTHASKLKDNPETFTSEIKFPYENICLGSIKKTSALSLSSVVQSWLRELSSFHNAENGKSGRKKTSKSSAFLNFRRDLLDAITQRDIDIVKYFDKNRFRGERYTNTAKIDYLSNKNAFNLAWFAPGENRNRVQQGESSLARLAALRNNSAKEHGNRRYHLIIAGAPENVNANIDGEAFKNMVEELSYSSEPLGIMLNSVTTSSELADKVLELEL